MSEEATPAVQPEVFTPRDALNASLRLLRAAEMETNLALMERLDELANTYLSWAFAAHELLGGDDE